MLAANYGAPAQDMVRVRRTIAQLASPGFHGRGYVRGGDQRAARFLQRRFRRLDLQPLAPAYRQPFPFTVNTFPGRLKLRAVSSTGQASDLRAGEDFIADPASGPGKISAPVVYLDTLIFTDEAAGQRFLATSLQGKAVVLRQRDADRLRTLPDAFAQLLATAAARVTLVPGKLTASLSDQQLPQPQVLVLAQRWPAGSTQLTLHVDAELRRRYLTQNVVGLITGSARPDSFLVVTAHYDHLGRMGRRTYFPGANDNASGTAMLLELAAHYALPENRPRYSIAFLAFSAEEAGLVGSRFFVEHPLLPLSRIRFLVNLDLEGTGQAGLTVVNGRIHEPAYRTLVQLNEQGRYVPNIAPRGRAANSDHYPFSEAGVPAFFIYMRGTPIHYHDVHDRAATLPLTGFQGTFRLVQAFLARLSAQPTR